MHKTYAPVDIEAVRSADAARMSSGISDRIEGSPQWQIEAMRRQKKYGFAPL
jgi:hypothetical protein